MKDIKKYFERLGIRSECSAMYNTKVKVSKGDMYHQYCLDYIKRTEIGRKKPISEKGFKEVLKDLGFKYRGGYEVWKRTELGEGVLSLGDLVKRGGLSLEEVKKGWERVEGGWKRKTLTSKS